MKVAVTGSHGLIGSALVHALRSDGHEVRPIVRQQPGPGEVAWDVRSGEIDVTALNGVDALVHLAGAGVGDHRWSASYRQRILESRTRGTEQLALAVAQLANPPWVMLSGSAVGFYGLRGDEVLTEASAAGDGFLADVCTGVEEAATKARASDAGTRVVHLRTGIVLGAAGGALKKQAAAVQGWVSAPDWGAAIST